MQYKEFLESKASTIKAVGFKPDRLNPNLFLFQRDIVDWALQLGKAAIFAGCGLGKSCCMLSWADAIIDHTGGKVLIVAPLSVTTQTHNEGIKFGIETRVTKTGELLDTDRIVITNYQSLHKFSATDFIGVVLDESSILKSLNGSTKEQIVEMFAHTQYKLACTATPSPNDYTELGNHADFLGVCSSTEMLATYFTHDGGDTSKWRLKGHAKREFWKWVSGWAVTIEKPSDIGYSDDGYDLPPIEYHEHIVAVEMAPDDGQLFKLEATDLMDRRRSRRNSIDDRVAKCAELVNASDEQWLVWCHLNDEGDALESAIDGATQIAGKDSDDQKESKMMGFMDDTYRVLVSKSQISGFGVNMQHCHNIAFVGMSDSYEQLYQAIRRCWRFGQTDQVHVHFITASSDGAVVRNIKRKERDMEVMIKSMIEEVSIGQDLKPTANESIEYITDKSSGAGWDLYHGDCVDVASALPSNSIDFSCFSPPFSSLYTYSNSTRDMGNSKSDEQFYKHYQFLMSEMYRVIKPGRLMSFHCMNLPTSKQNDGYIGIKDFRGDLIRMCQKVGFIYHSEVVIFKDPVVAMQRTKAIGLLHKQVKKDSAMSRQGIPDYLVTMRKPGTNQDPIAGKFDHFAGEEGHGLPTETIEDPTDRDSINIWQRYASPVWMDINPSRTLQKNSARADEDERHICLARDSKVLTYADGYKPIQDMKVGDLVLTHRGRWMPVLAVQMTGVSPVVAIRATGVHDLTVTPTHKLWTKYAGDVSHSYKQKAQKTDAAWIEAQNLKNSYINLKLPPVEDSTLTEKEWWLIGRYIADGHIAYGTTGRTSIHISVGNHKLDSFLGQVGELAGTTHKSCENCTQVRVKDPDKKLRDMAVKCGQKAVLKKIPPEAYRLNREMSKALLDGYLSGDGHYNESRDRWGASSVSKELLMGIAFLVQRVYGVTSTIHSGRDAQQRKMHGRTINCQKEWILSFQSHGYGFSFVDDEGAWKKVKSVTPQTENAETWNIRVAEDESYTAENCIVKNCPLQLDVIERAMQLWSNPNDLIFDPFNGIGSTGVVALQMQRRYVGSELKESYYDQAKLNLEIAASKKNQLSLFDV